jgi:hypothetical protein
VELGEANVPERLVYAPFIGAGFAFLLVLKFVGSEFAKAVTITNGVYIMLQPVFSFLIIPFLLF